MAHKRSFYGKMEGGYVRFLSKGVFSLTLVLVFAWQGSISSATSLMEPNSNPAAGKIWLEAESGSLRPPMQAASDGSASSGFYIWVPEGRQENYGMSDTGGSAKYRFQIDQSGNYLIWGRILAGGDQSDSFFVAVDRGSYVRWDVPRSQDWSWDAAMIIYLTRGEHTLTVLNREDGTKLDRILVTSIADYVPEGSGEGIEDSTAPPTTGPAPAADSTPAEGLIWLEAESGVFGAPMQSAADDSASSGRYVWVPEGRGDNYGLSLSGGSVNYRFQIAQPGEYRIWGRILAGGDRSDSFFLAVDNSNYVRWDVARLKDWSWDAATTVHLTAGEHTLRILNREDGTKLDRILIAGDLDYIPTGPGPSMRAPAPVPTPSAPPPPSPSPALETAPAEGQIWLEAEDGNLSLPMRTAADGSASAGACIWVPEGEWDNYGMYERGGSADYRFQVPESGEYRIWGRILAGGDRSDSFFIAIDGGSYGQWDVAHSPSWSWDLARTVHLTAGEHTLRILNREDGTKLDRILVTNDLNFRP